MCGICGIFGAEQPLRSVEPMLGWLAHRGPDHSDIWCTEDAALGHTRLSIVDLSAAGNQPLFNEDKTVVLVANGEIYNSGEMRTFLSSKGHRLLSKSDNEVLVHMYEEFGVTFAERINGMFALAIWDMPQRKLILARDRLGIKPLYYSFLPKGIIFASEIKAILSSRQVQAIIDPVGIKQYLTFENTFGRRTLFQNIHMLEPAQLMTWKNGGHHNHTYWQPDFSLRRRLTFDQAAHRYRTVARQSVQRHLMGDVEVASYLSSGFDSSTVGLWASGAGSGRLSTFTGAFDKSGWYDESEGARAVADAIGSAHSTVSISAADLRRNLDDLIFSLDEPRMGSGAFPQYMVAKHAAERVKVILTGHGGDELFAGYPVFKFIHMMLQYRHSPKEIWRSMGRLTASELPHIVYFFLQQFAGSAHRFHLPVLFCEERLRRGLQPEFYRTLQTIKPADELGRILDGENDPYRRLMLVYLKGYLPGLFVVEDKISMAHSLEARIPLCDNAMVSLGLSLPLAVKLHNSRLKAVPRAAMKPYLPGFLYEQPKRGFPTPLSHWLRSTLSEWLTQRLLGEQSRLHRLFKPQYLRRLTENYMNAWTHHFRPLDEIPTHRMWALLSLEAWLRTYEERLNIRLRLPTSAC